MKIRELGNKALELIYPQSLYCNCCGNIIDETRTYNLCDHCIRSFKWDLEPPKEINGLKMLRCVEYGIYERTLIFSLKYNGNTYIARDLANIMADRLRQADIDYDIIVPVPMYYKKEKARGFNQAQVIGKYLAKEMGKIQLSQGLIRIIDTKPMRGLSPEERENNVKGNILINPKYEQNIKGKKILLIDDFYTTGSTGRQSYNELLKGKPEGVIFMAFAAKY